MGAQENDCEVGGDKDAFLDGLAVLDEIVGAEAGLVAGADQMVEADKALLELLGWGAVEAGEEKGKDCWEVLCKCRTMDLLAGEPYLKSGKLTHRKS